MHTEKTIVIDIKLTKGLAWILLAIVALSALLLYLALGGEPAQASVQAQSTSLRQYYLTTTGVRGIQPLTACASGYHFASLWEIADPSNLQYNTSLGHTTADSGQGPPTGAYGWVRTGSYGNTLSTAGLGNCDTWSSLHPSYYGTRAILPDLWTSSTEDVGVWEVTTDTCDDYNLVWCIED